MALANMAGSDAEEQRGRRSRAAMLVSLNSACFNLAGFNFSPELAARCKPGGGAPRLLPGLCVCVLRAGAGAAARARCCCAHRPAAAKTNIEKSAASLKRNATVNGTDTSYLARACSRRG